MLWCRGTEFLINSNQDIWPHVMVQSTELIKKPEQTICRRSQAPMMMMMIIGSFAVAFVWFWNSNYFSIVPYLGNPFLLNNSCKKEVNHALALGPRPCASRILEEYYRSLKPAAVPVFIFDRTAARSSTWKGIGVSGNCPVSFCSDAPE